MIWIGFCLWTSEKHSLCTPVLPIFCFPSFTCHVKNREKNRIPKKCWEKKYQTYEHIQLLRLKSRSFVIFPSWHCEYKKMERQTNEHIEQNKTKVENINLFVHSFSAFTFHFQSLHQNDKLFVTEFEWKKLYWFDTRSRECKAFHTLLIENQNELEFEVFSVHRRNFEKLWEIGEKRKESPNILKILKI